ncbi:hypothetical protein CDAR_208511 [Caerostris darwini]|uniref:Uncharacterized protein n=1 Tax=Caerostris darwini TaxID=1538125 RepID=A0AAV4W568_9ARAC|nr:hypothetical protein CDAR_208511 [Caerostris darwini]
MILLYMSWHSVYLAGGVDDSIPLLASGKRQHNIMRFGKRPAGGHSLIHFGKRDEGSASIWDYLGQNRDASYKRGHAIMRFGKRGPDSHSFIRFGRSDDEDKRNSGHSMLYFGKRGNGHAMMYFGKRDEYPEDYEDKRSHAMIHFGKRTKTRTWKARAITPPSISAEGTTTEMR